MTVEQMKMIVEDVSFRDWDIKVRGSTFKFLQVKFNVDGIQHSGRKWYLSRHMTVSEVVQTALLAVLTAVEHEAREDFYYKGFDVFSPHINVNDLLMHRLDKREEDVRATTG